MFRVKYENIFELETGRKSATTAISVQFGYMNEKGFQPSRRNSSVLLKVLGGEREKESKKEGRVSVFVCVLVGVKSGVQGEKMRMNASAMEENFAKSSPRGRPARYRRVTKVDRWG